ncbi:cytochrome P450 [Mycena rosella]|uniref:Cytochrome P450 n=1 Tax=Mycena rosella TaxID=1033263 RepID=A0AAD7BM86_MYCRO|nr:cytochrome P450 [Mycena rosella]
MTRPYFARDRVQHFEIFDNHAEKTIALIETRMQEGCAVDFQDLIGRFTMDAATDFLFGPCVESLSTHKKDFPTAFGDVMLQIAFRERGGWFEGADTGESDSLLDELLNSTTDPKILRDEILATYPKVTARLRDEIIAVVGRADRPSYDDIKEKIYLKAKLCVFIRLSHSTSGIVARMLPTPSLVLNGTVNRETVKATTWPSPVPNDKPIYIPAGVKSSSVFGDDNAAAR